MKSIQIARSFSGKISRTVHLNYLISFPPGYQSRRKILWPMIFFLHGSGERGRQISKVAAHGPPKVVRSNPNLPFIIVSPQCPSGQCWDNHALIPLLDHLLAKYPADPKRVYLTGISMGGYGAWTLALSCPERFAAVAPICGGGDILPVLLADRNKTARLKRLPVWAFHGAKDDVVDLAESKRLVEALHTIGNPAKLTIYPDAGHDCWTDTYTNPELYSWFLSHKRS